MMTQSLQADTTITDKSNRCSEGHVLSAEQLQCLDEIRSFLVSNNDIFILRGSAGTGKTTIISGMLDDIKALGKSVQLMAPTGRAAKIISDKTKCNASTIHRAIYNFSKFKQSEEEDLFSISYNVALQPAADTSVIIVDEASMISDRAQAEQLYYCGSGKVLSDLLEYAGMVTSGPRSKIIFIGDYCQLPPVGDNNSAALDKVYLEQVHRAQVQEFTLSTVYRQNENSAILDCAATLRSALEKKLFSQFTIRERGEIQALALPNMKQKFLETTGNKVIITYRNSTAFHLNESVRTALYNRANAPMQIGELMICGHNNYAHNILNGEFFIVCETGKVIEERTVRIKTKSGPVTVTMRWCDIVLRPLAEKPYESIVKGKILLNFLESANDLSLHERIALFVDFKQRHPGLKPKTEEFRNAILFDQYYNAVMFKYGYAVTCHKAQGGEWESVFVYWEHHDIHKNQKNSDNKNIDYNRIDREDIQLGNIEYGNNNDEDMAGEKRSSEKRSSEKRGSDITEVTNKAQVRASAGLANEAFFRWAYTAVTRAKESLYIINHPEFTPYSDLTLRNISTPVITSKKTQGLIPSQQQQRASVPSGGKNRAVTQGNGFSEENNTETKSTKEINSTDYANQQSASGRKQLQENVLNTGTTVEYSDNADSSTISRVLRFSDDHVSEINGVAQEAGWRVSGFIRNGYEVMYYFERKGKQLVFKTHLNKKEEFNGKFVAIPSLCKDSAAATMVINQLHGVFSPAQASAKKNQATQQGEIRVSSRKGDGQLSDGSWPEDEKILIDGLIRRVTEIIVVQELEMKQIERFPYRVRCTIGNERFDMILDFVYKSGGFFSTAEVKQLSNCTEEEGIILADFIVNQLKGKYNDN